MTSLALPSADLLDIVLVSDGGDPPPEWAQEWAESIAVRAHVDIGRRRASRRNLWALRLDEAVRRVERPTVIVAYGVSCFALAWWARLSPTPYLKHVRGALLVRPLGSTVAAALRSERDYAAAGMRLPFRSIVVGDGETDSRALALAQHWGGDFVGFDGFDRNEAGLGAHALAVGNALIERLATTRVDSEPAKPDLRPANQWADCAAVTA